MSGYRLEAVQGSAIDRTRSMEFRFNGKTFKAFQGDTLASALLASGVRLVGRSYKLHRPRGIFSCGVEEPIGLLQVGTGASATPNTRATDVQVQEGMTAISGNCWPSLRFDLAALNDRLSSLLPAGFYYKTFMWPSWHLFEPSIRRMAAGFEAPSEPDADRYDTVSWETDVLVVGAGVSAQEAALSAAKGGARVMLVSSGSTVDAELISLGVKVLRRTTAVGLYDHHLLTAVEANPPASVARERLHKIRARAVILGTGSFERPMVFPNNDRPGVMLATAVLRYAKRYAVACGRRAVVAASADYAYALAAELDALGIAVQAIVERRATVAPDVLAQVPAHIPVLLNAAIADVQGGDSVNRVTVVEAGQHRRTLEVDLVCSAGGATPNVNLFSQAGGTLRWLEDSSMFVPDRIPLGVAVVGACAGIFNLEQAVEHARAVGRAAAAGNDALAALEPPTALGLGMVLADNRPAADWLARKPGKSFVDLQHDVSADDIALAARENYRSVEHLKRYTTTGMGTDQGKTSNINALVQMGLATGRTPDAVGTTKFRPPYKPVTLNLLAAGRSGQRLRPSKKLPAHDWHLQRGAVMEEFGAWQRPAYYPKGSETMEQAAQREVKVVRSGVGVFDGSPLGKIEVHGPDAAAFLDWMYVGTMSTLKVGQARYGCMLTETGILMDDGIVARLAEDHFWVNASSGGAERIALHFEDWLQRDLMHLRASVTSVTSQWANLTLAGPHAWDVLEAAGFTEELAPQHMPHMTLKDVQWQGKPVRVLRASFSGEKGYELNIPAGFASALFEAVWQAGQSHGIAMYGVEALQILRIEKGYIHIGSDSDGASYPDDMGLLRLPIQKTSDFSGRRSLAMPVATDAHRQQLVGLVPVDGTSPLVVGAHITDAPPPSSSQGFVTSSCFSPSLGHPIALARLTRGRSRIGEHIQLFHMGNWVPARVVQLPFLDPKGERLHVR